LRESTPAGIVDKLNNEIKSALADDKTTTLPFPAPSADLTKFVADETEKWGKVIRALNIKAE
jgi:tripartite-type tricarboxylate transporter receptor subunit TctC